MLYLGFGSERYSFFFLALLGRAFHSRIQPPSCLPATHIGLASPRRSIHLDFAPSSRFSSSHTVRLFLALDAHIVPPSCDPSYNIRLVDLIPACAFNVDYHRIVWPRYYF